MHGMNLIRDSLLLPFCLHDPNAAVLAVFLIVGRMDFLDRKMIEKHNPVFGGLMCQSIVDNP